MRVRVLFTTTSNGRPIARCADFRRFTTATPPDSCCAYLYNMAPINHWMGLASRFVRQTEIQAPKGFVVNAQLAGRSNSRSTHFQKSPQPTFFFFFFCASAFYVRFTFPIRSGSCKVLYKQWEQDNTRIQNATSHHNRHSIRRPSLMRTRKNKRFLKRTCPDGFSTVDGGVGRVCRGKRCVLLMLRYYRTRRVCAKFSIGFTMQRWLFHRSQPVRNYVYVFSSA
jgi:hypothetical protein